MAWAEVKRPGLSWERVSAPGIEYTASDMMLACVCKRACKPLGVPPNLSELLITQYNAADRFSEGCGEHYGV